MRVRIANRCTACAHTYVPSYFVEDVINANCMVSDACVVIAATSNPTALHGMPFFRVCAYLARAYGKVFYDHASARARAHCPLFFAGGDSRRTLAIRLGIRVCRVQVRAHAKYTQVYCAQQKCNKNVHTRRRHNRVCACVRTYGGRHFLLSVLHT